MSVDWPSMSLLNFVQMQVDCHHREKSLQQSDRDLKRFYLPSTSVFTGEESFADVAMSWNSSGLYFLVLVKSPEFEVYFPELEKGDSVELFIDTRDVKTSGFNTRFCHHFFFFPERVNGIQCGEITRFRTDDSHELCNPKELSVEAKTGAEGYSLSIFIPAACLHGYDPTQFDRLGFTYRINRSEGEPQHFSVISEEYAVDQQPSLWASIRLIT